MMGRARSRHVKIFFLVLLVVVLDLAMARPSSVVKSDAKRVCLRKGKGIYETNHWCCSCEIGHFKKRDCRKGHPTNTVCSPCIFDPSDPSKQTYMDVENNYTQCFKSLSQDKCLSLMNTGFMPGSSKRDGRCVCNDGCYSRSESVLAHGCNRHSPCEPGFYPKELGTNTSDTKCTNCHSGTFSDESSPTSICKPFSKCGPGEIKRAKGTKTSDVVCFHKIGHDTKEVTSPESSFEAKSTQALTTFGIEDASPNNTLIIVLILIVAAFGLVSIVGCLCYRYQKRNRKSVEVSEEANKLQDHTKDCDLQDED